MACSLVSGCLRGLWNCVGRTLTVKVSLKFRFWRRLIDAFTFSKSKGSLNTGSPHKIGSLVRFLGGQGSLLTKLLHVIDALVGAFSYNIDFCEISLTPSLRADWSQQQVRVTNTSLPSPRPWVTGSASLWPGNHCVVTVTSVLTVPGPGGGCGDMLPLTLADPHWARLESGARVPGPATARPAPSPPPPVLQLPAQISGDVDNVFG